MHLLSQTILKGNDIMTCGEKMRGAKRLRTTVLRIYAKCS